MCLWFEIQNVWLDLGPVCLKVKKHIELQQLLYHADDDFWWRTVPAMDVKVKGYSCLVKLVLLPALWSTVCPWKTDKCPACWYHQLCCCLWWSALSPSPLTVRRNSLSSPRTHCSGIQVTWPLLVVSSMSYGSSKSRSPQPTCFFANTEFDRVFGLCWHVCLDQPLFQKGDNLLVTFKDKRAAPT